MKQTKNNAIVTGATGAIGGAIARQLAAKGYQLTLIVRSEAKGIQTASEIKAATGNPDIHLLTADLSLKKDIERIASAWNQPLKLLVNNAAAAPRRREVNVAGIEMQWATNVLGYFWMMKFFTPHLKSGAPSRIVNVASYWAGDLDLSDPECKKRRYNNDMIYRQSKQADRMLSVAFAEKLKADGITVNAVHPGNVNSVLSNNLGYGGSTPPDQGADTPVWVATAPELEGITGKYFEHRRQTFCPFSEMHQEIQRLTALCESY